jgi:hypothetical protein
MKALPLLFAALLLTACETARYGAGGVNILIMGEDADPDAVPRDSQVFKRVLDALANELNGEGFNVYDETALTLGGFAQGRLRRTDAEIIDIARSLKRPPIDVAVIYTIYSRSRSLGHADRVYVRIAGRLLDVRAGRRLGNFEVEPPGPAIVAPGCGSPCRLEVVGADARTLARDLGAVLAGKLKEREKPSERTDGGLSTAYTLTFTGFDMKAWMRATCSRP